MLKGVWEDAEGGNNHAMLSVRWRDDIGDGLHEDDDFRRRRWASNDSDV